MTRATGKKELVWRPVAGRAARAGATHGFTAPLSGGLQTRLQRGRPRAMRRHAARKAIRLAVLVTVDCLAAMLAFSLCRPVGVSLLDAVASFGGSGEPRFPTLSFVSVSVVLSLLVSGAYARGSQAQGSVRLLRGASLAGALGALATVHSSAAGQFATIFALWTTLLWLALALGRVLSERILISILAQARLAAPAILVGARGTDTVPGGEGTRHSEGSYHVGCVRPPSWCEATHRGSALADAGGD